MCLYPKKKTWSSFCISQWACGSSSQHNIWNIGLLYGLKFQLLQWLTLSVVQAVMAPKRAAQKSKPKLSWHGHYLFQRVRFLNILRLLSSVFDNLHCESRKTCAFRSTTLPSPSSKRLRRSVGNQMAVLPPLTMCLMSRLRWGRSMTGWPSRDPWTWQTFNGFSTCVIQGD